MTKIVFSKTISKQLCAPANVDKKQEFYRQTTNVTNIKLKGYVFSNFIKKKKINE